MDFFTVKQIREDGTESLWPTRHIDVSKGQTGSLYDDRVVSFTDLASEEIVQLKDGSIFVMNGTGKTVSTYRLGPGFKGVSPLKPADAARRSR